LSGLRGMPVGTEVSSHPSEGQEDEGRNAGDNSIASRNLIMPSNEGQRRYIEADDWYLARTRGSHRQFKHPLKKGLVTIAGKQDADVMPKTLKSILKQADIRGFSDDQIHDNY